MFSATIRRSSGISDDWPPSLNTIRSLANSPHLTSPPYTDVYDGSSWFCFVLDVYDIKAGYVRYSKQPMHIMAHAEKVTLSKLRHMSQTEPLSTTYSFPPLGGDWGGSHLCWGYRYEPNTSLVSNP